MHALHKFYIALHCNFTVRVSLFSALPLYKPRQVLQWFYSGHCKNHCNIYSGYTVSIQWVEALNIVNLQWFYSAVGVERRFFLQWKRDKKVATLYNCTMYTLQIYSVATVKPLYTHCKGHCSRIDFGAGPHCKFTVQGKRAL